MSDDFTVEPVFTRTATSIGTVSFVFWTKPDGSSGMYADIELLDQNGEVMRTRTINLRGRIGETREQAQDTFIAWLREQAVTKLLPMIVP